MKLIVLLFTTNINHYLLYTIFKNFVVSNALIILYLNDGMLSTMNAHATIYLIVAFKNKSIIFYGVLESIACGLPNRHQIINFQNHPHLTTKIHLNIFIILNIGLKKMKDARQIVNPTQLKMNILNLLI